MDLGFFTGLLREHWTWALGVLAALVILGVLLGLAQPRHRDYLDRQRSSSRRWASLTDLADLVSRQVPADRLALGRIGRHRLWGPRWRSKLVLAPTGAGKTPRQVVPDVLLHQGPAVVTSIKSDVLHLTEHHRASLGPVWVFDPAGDSGRVSCRWSPLDHVRDWPSAVDAATWLTKSSRRDVAATANDEFWTTMARSVLGPAIYAAHLMGQPLRRVGEWVQAQDVKAISRILTDHGAQMAMADWQVAARAEMTTRANVFTSAASILQPWMHPVVAAVTDTTVDDGGPVLVVRDLVHGVDGSVNTLYAIGTSERQAILAPVFEALMNAITSEIARSYQATATPLSPALLMMLDEAANICPVRDLGQWASAMAGQGMILVSVWQDHGQIIERYGQHLARAIISNHTTHVLLPGISDIETLKEVSARVGRDQFRTTSLTSQRSQSHTSTTSQLSEFDVAPPEWIREALRPGQALVLVSGHKPALVQVPGWWEDRGLRERVGPQVAARFDALYAKAGRR